MKPSISLFLICILALAPLAPAAQKAEKAQKSAPAAQPAFEMTIDSIMRGSGLYGYEPRGVRWSGDSQKIYFEWKQATDPREKDWDTWVVNRDGSGLRKLSEDEAKAAPPGGGGFGGFEGRGFMRGGGMDRTKDKKWGVLAENGDLFLYEIATGKKRQLTKTTDPESSPRFTSDGRHVTFIRANNLYVLSLDSGEIEQLTDLRSAAATPAAGAPATGGFGMGIGRGGAQAAATTDQERRGTDSQEYLKKEEKELLEVVKRRAAKREEDAAKRKKQTASDRKPYTLQGRQTVFGLYSPDQKLGGGHHQRAGRGFKDQRRAQLRDRIGLRGRHSRTRQGGRHAEPLAHGDRQCEDRGIEVRGNGPEAAFRARGQESGGRDAGCLRRAG